jgi:hypothetical protein
MNLNFGHACSELAAEGAMVRLGYAHVIPGYNNEKEKEKMMKNRTRSLMSVSSSLSSLSISKSDINKLHQHKSFVESHEIIFHSSVLILLMVCFLSFLSKFRK